MHNCWCFELNEAAYQSHNTSNWEISMVIIFCGDFRCSDCCCCCFAFGAHWSELHRCGQLHNLTPCYKQMHVIKCTNVFFCFAPEDAAKATESEIYTVDTYSILIRSRSFFFSYTRFYNLNVEFHFTPRFVDCSFFSRLDTDLSNWMLWPWSMNVFFLAILWTHKSVRCFDTCSLVSTAITFDDGNCVCDDDTIEV